MQKLVSRLVSHSPASLCTQVPYLRSWATTGSKQCCGVHCLPTGQPYHSSSSCFEADNAAADAEQPEASSSSLQDSSAAQQRATGPVHAPHISINHPSLNFKLVYNKKFVMDADRKYSIGWDQHADRVRRMELLKALAAQRLYLKDVAASAHNTRQPPMRDQMLARLTEMQQACRQ